MTRIALLALLAASLAVPAFASGPILDVTVSDRGVSADQSQVHSPEAARIFALLAAEAENDG